MYKEVGGASCIVAVTLAALSLTLCLFHSPTLLPHHLPTSPHALPNTLLQLIASPNFNNAGKVAGEVNFDVITDVLSQL